MKGLEVFDSENRRLGGKMNEQKLPMRWSLGNDVRRLSDITNLRRSFSPMQYDSLKPVSMSANDYIELLHKENMTLLKLCSERNKIIELTGAELTKLRINVQKLQQQNWQLAQANSQMLAEFNLGKDRLKSMNHELGCKAAVIAAKNLELQEKVKKKPCLKSCTENCDKGKTEAAHFDNGDSIICQSNKRRQSRIQSQGSSSTGTEQVATKEKTQDKGFVGQSTRMKSEQREADSKSVPCWRKSEHGDPEPKNEKTESKRFGLCLRRQSTRLSTPQMEPTEDLFEIEDAKFPIDPLCDVAMQECTTSSTTEVKKGKNASSSETPALRRSSVGRPLRRAAEKVQCYKEIPVNIKMRRE